MDIKQYHRMIIDDISLITGVATRAMMGGYVVYYNGKVVGGLYESGFLIKNIDAVKHNFDSIRYESSAFSYINVNTRPYTTTGFKISSTTKTSIKMQWNKNISASGYCIEKWDGSKWVQIKRFTSNANVSYTVVSGLKANTSYKFRLRAYKTIGTVNEYSAYTQTLTAKTKA